MTAPFSGAVRLAEDTRRRFLAEIASRVPLDRLEEIHLFTPIRQSGTESGVAVVVARRVEEAIEAPQCDPTEDAAGPVEVTAEEPADEEPADEEPAEESLDEPREHPDEEPVERPREKPSRHTIFTAHYRLTIKGPDRGKWSFDCVEEADAPLITVAAVVRGVQRRAGDAADPDRLDADAVARALGATPPEPA